MLEPDPGRSADRRHDALRAFAARVRNSQSDTSALDRAAAEALTAIKAAGVDALLLKGGALAVLLYDGRGRGYSDVDLLVAPSDLDAAERTLTALGYSNVDAVQGVDDGVGVVQAHTWMRSGRGALEQEMVDLHWALPGAAAPPSRQWQTLASRTIEIEVAGHRAKTLDLAGQALHLAMHAAQHGPSFEKHVRELQLALRRWPLDVWRSAAVLAQELDASQPFAAGLRLVPEGAELAAQLRLPTSALDWMLRQSGGQPRGTIYLRALTESGSVRERLRVLGLSLLPSQAWIAYQFPWARRTRLRLAAGYALHLLRLPLWGARAAMFLLRARRAVRDRGA